MDLNKRVYNHVPGECNNIASMENGAVDMQVMDLTSGVLLISAVGARFIDLLSTQFNRLLYRDCVCTTRRTVTRRARSTLTTLAVGRLGKSASTARRYRRRTLILTALAYG